ncbi:MAG: hypothetical protein ACXACG_11645 [Candidatus Thorarchaeota archaeon]|jgi:hypothetical protein
MIQLLELTLNQATIIAIGLPIIVVCLFILIVPWLRNGSGSKLRRYLSYLVTPPRIGSDKSGSSGDDVNQVDESSWRKDKVRLYFYYLGIALFLISFILAEFYEVMFDLVLPVSQGSTGEFRTVSSVIFQSPFKAGWVGALPWAGIVFYYEPWKWILFTAAFTDNPDFFGELVIAMLLISIAVGSVYLVPLAIRRIRHSFLPSMFFFMTGMTIFSKAAIGCTAQALVLAFGNASIQYLNLIATGDNIPILLTALAIEIPIILAMFALFIVLGRKLWQVHYADSKSRSRFTVYIALSYWLGFLLTILVV